MVTTGTNDVVGTDPGRSVAAPVPALGALGPLAVLAAIPAAAMIALRRRRVRAS